MLHRAIRIQLIFNCCLFLAASGCRSSDELRSPQRLTLFSLHEIGNDDYSDPTRFYGYPIRGATDITDATLRNEIVAELYDAIRSTNPEARVKCFDPHHGLRIVENGRTVDYAICISCRGYQKFVGGECVESGAILMSTSTWDKALVDAGVPVFVWKKE